LHALETQFEYPHARIGVEVPIEIAGLKKRCDAIVFNQQMQPQMNQPMPTQTTQAQQTGNGLIWVQGEAGAKSYLVAPGNTVMLMDSEGSRFYLKSADASGMPMPLRIFDFKERTDAPGNTPQAPVSAETIDINKLVTRDEFERRMASMAQQLGIAQNTEVQNNG
jgi:hypothetical protein